MSSKQRVSNRGRTGAKRLSDAGGLAVVRVTISCDKQDYLVRVEPRKCSPFEQRLLHGSGRICLNLRSRMDCTLPQGLADYIGVPDDALRRRAEVEIQSHGRELEKVLWGEEVWGERHEDHRNWWRRVVSSRDFLVIELVLCPEVRRYMWESLLAMPELPAAKTAIVRMYLEDIENLESLEPLRKAANPVWLVLLSDPEGDLQDLLGRVDEKLNEIQANGSYPIERVSPGFACGHMGSLEQALRRLDSRQVALFLYVGHAQVQHDQPLFVMESSGHQRDSVNVTRLQAAFGPQWPVILLLVGCSLGKSGGAIDQLLHMSKVIVCMQLELSPSAAEMFLNGFLDGLSRPMDLYSVEGIARIVAHTRQRMLTRTRSSIEAVTPVIYSRVPVVIPELLVAPNPTRSVIFSLLLMLMLMLVTASAPSLDINNPFEHVKLEVETFTVDGETVDTGVTYTIAVPCDARTELIIKANLTVQPSGYYPQLGSQWRVIDDREEVVLSDFQDFLEIVCQVPPAGKAEMFNVFIEDARTGVEVNAYFILKCASQEELKGALP